MCTGTRIHCEHSVRERMVRPGRRMRRVCTGPRAHREHSVRERVPPAAPGPWRTVHEHLIRFFQGFNHDAHPMAIMVGLAQVATRGESA